MTERGTNEEVDDMAHCVKCSEENVSILYACSICARTMTGQELDARGECCFGGSFTKVAVCAACGEPTLGLIQNGLPKLMKSIERGLFGDGR
jgi:hypothetical protein